MAKIASKRPPRNVVPAPRTYQAQTTMSLTKPAVGAVLIKLSRIETHEAREFYARVMGSWGTRADRERVTLKLTATEAELIRSMSLPPTLVECPRWEAVYSDPNSGVEVTVRTQDKPKKHRTFRVRGGSRKLTLASLIDLSASPSNGSAAATTPKEATRMATRTRSKKAAPVEELDELEGLEELDELEELEDEVEEEAPKPKRSRSRTKKAAVVEEEPEDEEEDEEDEEPAPKRSRSRKIKPAAKPAAKSTKTAPTPPNRELPTGKLGPSDIAALAGVEARDVRGYLRKQGVEKDETLGRYAFTKKQAETHAKAIKKAAAGK